jgi:hypothetical protein
MIAIKNISGQEYVDAYASDVKNRLIEEAKALESGILAPDNHNEDVKNEDVKDEGVKDKTEES